MTERITLTVLAVAAASGGVCTRRELVAAGLSPSAIDRRIRNGLLDKVCDGVYAVASLSSPRTPMYRALKGIPGVVISRQTAAGLHGFPVDQRREQTIHVTALSGRSQSLAGVKVHESRRLTDDDIVILDGSIPTTSPARTIVDLASQVGFSRLRHIIQRQIADNAPSASELHACFNALSRRGRPGIAVLRVLLLELFDAPPLPVSELEIRVQIGLIEEGITGLITQVQPPWFDGVRGVVDFVDPAGKLIIEADGRRWHATEQAMADDRRRDRLATAQGWVVLRVSWTEVVHRPAATFGELALIIRSRRDSLAA